jgi:hypothetical protein
MIISLAATARYSKATGLTSPSAMIPPTQQKPIPHLEPPVWEPVPFVSGQQSSIDMSASPLMCMVVAMSSDDIARFAADTPAGSTAKDMAMANAKMVRTNCINIGFRRRNMASVPYSGTENSH